MNRLTTLGLIILFAASALSCSSKDGTPVESGIKNQVLHLGNGDEPSGIDPHITTGMPEFHIQMAVFEGLVSKHPDTLEPVPAVAESWEVSDDGKTYTFKIRPEAKWSNGVGITAHDFVGSWERALLPALGNQYAYSLYVIENAEAFHKGELKDFSQVGIRAIDDETLQVTLSSPTPYFLQLLDHHSMYPVPIETIKKLGSVDDRASQWGRPEHFVGNGPFTIKTWEPNKVIVVEKNPHYWDADIVRLNEIHFHPVQQVNTEERMFRSGQLHVTNSLPSEKIQSYKESQSDVLRLSPYFGTYYYKFNTRIKPLDDPRVRKALAYAVDRESIVNNVTKGEQPVAFNLTPPDTLGYTAEARLRYDPALARELLAEAGFPGGEGFPTLELLYNTLEDHKKIAVAIQQMWKTELGVNITLHNQDWKVFLASIRTGDYQIARASWIGDYLDPNTFLDLFVTDGGNNQTGWSNARYDELIKKAGESRTKSERYGYFQEAESILMDEAPIMPIYTYTRTYLVHPAVKGWDYNILDYHPYKYVYLSAAED